MRPVVRLKIVLWLLLSAPLVWLAWLLALEAQLPTSGLGADPVEGLVHYLGEWALIVLLSSFSVSSVRRFVSWPTLGRVRRLVGLFAFAYVSLHVLAFTAFYIEFSLVELVTEVAERPYITVGMAAWLALALLAATSTRGWQRRLAENWRRLHRLIYPAVALALLHLWWQTRDGFGEPLLLTLWFGVLLGERVYAWRRA